MTEPWLPAAEPLPLPRCPQCQRELVVAHDRRSGAPVREGGRALMRCPLCGNLAIAADPVRDRARVRKYRLVSALAAAAFTAASLVYAFARHTWPRESGVTPSLVAGLAVVALMWFVPLWQFLSCVAYAMHPRPQMNAVERWALVVFWCVGLMLASRLAYIVLSEMLWGRVQP